MTRKMLCVLLALTMALPVPVMAQQPTNPTADVGVQARAEFARAVIQAGRQAGLDGRQMFRLRVGLTFHGAAIRSQVTARLWQDGAIPGNFAADGTYDYDSLEWGDGTIIDKIIEYLPLILEFIETLLRLFGGLGEVTPGFAPSQTALTPADQARLANLEKMFSKVINATANDAPDSKAPTAPPNVRTITMHKMPGCVHCETWQQEQAQQYLDAGWRVVAMMHNPPQSGVSYPYFDIDDGRGGRWKFKGVLGRADFEKLIK